MNYPISKKSKLVTYKTYVMILSITECIEVCTDSLKIEMSNNIHVCNLYKNDNQFEAATQSEFQLAFSQTTKEVKNIITTTEETAAA